MSIIKLFPIVALASVLSLSQISTASAENVSESAGSGFWTYTQAGGSDVAGLGPTVATSASSAGGMPQAKCTDKRKTYSPGKNETPITEMCLEGGDHAFISYVSGPEKSDALVVYIHGDTYKNGRVEPVKKKVWVQMTGWAAIDYVKGTGDAQPSILNIIRPGEEVQSLNGDLRASSGSNLSGRDNHTPPLIRDMGKAIQLRMQQVGASRVLIIGHSGGATYATVIADMYPDLAPHMGVMAVSCPCDVKAWRRHAAFKYDEPKISRFTRSEDPMDHLDNIRPDTIIWALTPYNDENTLPRFAETYIQTLQARGHDRARFVELEKGKGHKFKYQYVLPYAKELLALLRQQG